MADFQFYLNRQGIRGLQGVKGDQGDSPIITVQTETPNEYILKITNPDGTELISPNLRGNKININEGTYVRYNTVTGELYTSTADGATGELAGVVRLATDADVTNMDERAVVTPSQLADALSKYLTSPDGSVKITQNIDTSLTELTTKGGLTELPIASADTLGGVKIGENLSITEDGVLSSTASGDVSASGNNTFTGTNNFNGAVNLNGTTTAEDLTVARNLTSSGEINAVSIKSTGIRSDDIKTTTNKKYLTEEDVDNQTIQIVEGKLHANFDEINREVSNVSSRVTTLEGQVGDISTTLNSNTTDIENLKETKNNNIFDIGKFTVVGNPTITEDGIVSGFSSNNYIKASITTVSSTSTFEIKIKFKLSEIPSTWTKIWGIYSGGYSQVYITANGLTFTWPVNGTNYNSIISFSFTGIEDVTYIFGWDGTQIYSRANINGLDYTGSSVSLATSVGFSGIYFANVGSTGAPFNGSIDLKQFSITVDGKEVFSGLMESTKPIYDAIKANNTELSEFKTETSTDFSAVNSALNEKANLTDLALKQNMLVSGTNIKTINGETILGEGNITVGGSTPTVIDGGNSLAN